MMDENTGKVLSSVDNRARLCRPDRVRPEHMQPPVLRLRGCRGDLGGSGEWVGTSRWPGNVTTHPKSHTLQVDPDTHAVWISYSESDRRVLAGVHGGKVKQVPPTPAASGGGFCQPATISRPDFAGLRLMKRDFYSQRNENIPCSTAFTRRDFLRSAGGVTFLALIPEWASGLFAAPGTTLAANFTALPYVQPGPARPA